MGECSNTASRCGRGASRQVDRSAGAVAGASSALECLAVLVDDERASLGLIWDTLFVRPGFKSIPTGNRPLVPYLLYALVSVVLLGGGRRYDHVAPNVPAQTRRVVLRVSQLIEILAVRIFLFHILNLFELNCI